MPWKVEERDSRYCVIKEDGEVEGCHDTRDEANAQLRALYASEQKESFISTLVNRIVEAIRPKATEQKSVTKTEPPASGFMVWKEADSTYRWIARYSNNFRDNDNPPEIISGQSHKEFVERVEKGLAALPELWLWHVPEWKVGQADWVAFDEQPNGVVFALAGGTFDKEANWIAEQMAQVSTIGVSHGMPIAHLKRDSSDKSVITSHVTTEISPLFPWAAANRLADFYVLETKEDSEMIPQEKRAALTKPVAEGGWGLDDEKLAELEARNAMTAQTKAQDVEYKEKEMDEKDETKEAEPLANETQVEQQSQPEAGEPQITRQEVADALTAVVNLLSKQMQEVSQKLEALQGEIKSVKEASTVATVAKAESVPAASLAHMVIRSVIGSEDARIDGRSTLAKSGPAEAKPPKQAVTGVDFIDSFIQN